jgi:MraZ protein
MVFRGQYDCKMDDKGRIKMPAALRNQFSAEDGNKFMIARDLVDCLVIYPMKTWDKQEANLQKLNAFNPDHQKFIDAVTAGLTEVEMDSADRFLVGKSLSKYLGTGKDIVMKGKVDRIQVWDAAKYEQYSQGNISNIQELAGKAAAYLDTLNEEKGK